MATEAHFAIGFPEIDDLSVNIEEFDHLGGFVSKRSFNRENLYDHIPCSDPKCHLGGFEIGFMLRSIIRLRKDHVEISDICRGEQGKKGDLDYRRLCLHTFKADVSIRYNNPKTLISIPLNIMSVGVNHALKHALIQNAPDSKGTTTFTIGDSKQVADGVTLRYDYEASYHAQEVAEPIYFNLKSYHWHGRWGDR